MPNGEVLPKGARLEGLAKITEGESVFRQGMAMACGEDSDEVHGADLASGA